MGDGSFRSKSEFNALQADIGWDEVFLRRMTNHLRSKLIILLLIILLTYIVCD